MGRLIDHHASRALAYRSRAIELAQQAKREDDPGQRRFLIDKARNMVNVADALAPLPPDKPQVFKPAPARNPRECSAARMPVGSVRSRLVRPLLPNWVAIEVAIRRWPGPL
jgi:hypothetical protein